MATATRPRGSWTALLAAAASVALLLGAAVTPATAAEGDHLVGEMTPELRQRIQARVDEFRTNKTISGVSVAVVTPQRGSSAPVVTTFVSGYTTIADTVAVTPTTQFELGSETKAFTAGLLAYLLAENRISLDDPVSQYAKTPNGDVWEWPANGADPAVPITIGMLATHSSGLSDKPWNFEAPCNRDPTLPACTTTPNNPRPYYDQQDLWNSVDPNVRPQELLWEPGTRWFYSNWGFALLGAILANIIDDVPITDVPRYQPALDGAFLTALGMTRTNLEWPDAEVATPYLPPTSAAPRGTETWRWDNTNAFAGGGGLISNAVDLSAWVAAHLGYVADGAPVGVRSLANTLQQVGTVTEECNTVTDPNTNQSSIVCTPPNFQSGLAWQLYPAGSGGIAVPWAYKNGGTEGSSTDTVMAPSLRVGVTEMFNQKRVDGDSIAQAILAEIVNFRPARPILPVTGPSLDAVILPAVLGAALLGAGVLLRIRRRPGVR